MKNLLKKAATRSVIVSIALILLAGCNNADSKASEADSFRIVSMDETIESEYNGMFDITNRSRLDFVDFSSLEAAPICDDPTCKHEPRANADGEMCQAYGKSNHPFIYKNMLYYFRDAEYTEIDGIYYRGCEFWQSEINGTGNKLLLSFDKLMLYEYTRALLFKNRLYLPMTIESHDKDFNEFEPAIELISIDLDDNTYSDYGKARSGYSIDGEMMGVVEGKVVFQINYPETNLPFMEKVNRYIEENKVSDEEAIRAVTENETYLSEQFEINDDSFRKCDKQGLLCVSKKGYYYIKDGKPEYVGKDGKTKTYEITLANAGASYVGEYVILSDGSGKAWLIDESKGELLPMKYLPQIIIIKDGQALVSDYTNNEKTIKRIPVNELIQ